MNEWPAFLYTIEQIAEIAADSVENIQEFVREDRVPYVALPDGILIPLGGFQCCMNDLYDLVGDLKAIQEAFGWDEDTEED
jgi:hypothetical protein